MQLPSSSKHSTARSHERRRSSSTPAEPQRSSSATKVERVLLLAVAFVSVGLPIAFLLTNELSDWTLASSKTSDSPGFEPPSKEIKTKIARGGTAKTANAIPRSTTKVHSDKTKRGHGEKQTKAKRIINTNDRNEKAYVTFYGQDDGSGCSLIGSSFKFLGCGFNGHAFSVLTACDTATLQNKDEGRIVVKLTSKAVTNSTLHNDTRPLGMYANETRGRSNSVLYERFFRFVHQQRMSHEERENYQKKILQHFILQIGVVHIPPSLLQYAALDFNRSVTRAMRFRGIVPLQHDPQHTDDEPSVVKGELYELLSGSTAIPFWLGHKHNRMEEEGRQQHVVRQLVFMYRHMYERGILHCDMKLDHLMYSPLTNTTSIIDFDVYRLNPMPPQVDRELATATTEKRKKVLETLLKQKKQQWQLLVLIANICDSKAQQSQQKELPLAWGQVLCNGDEGPEIALVDPQQHFAAIFDKCKFDTPMVWSADMINHTRDTYQALAEWSGL